jgi:hypothetical protein
MTLDMLFAAQRSHLADVLAVVEHWDDAAFVTVEEPKVLRGGSVAVRVNPISSLFRMKTAR